MKISIIGAGRVGLCLAMILKENFNIVGISNTNTKILDQINNLLSNVNYVGKDNKKAALQGDIIFITTPDDIIPKIDEEIFKNFKIKNKVVFHCSGCNPSSILKYAKNNNCHIGSLHPLQSVPNLEKGIENLKNAYFCIEGDEKAVEIAKDIVEKISGKYFTIKTEYKPLYHLGAVFSSNFINAVVFTTCEIYKKIGIEQDYNKILEIITPLIEGAINGIKNLGIINSLTGPIVRGDSETINKHINALKKEFPELINLYIELSKQTIKIALNQIKDDIEIDKIHNLNQILENVYGNKA